MSTIEWPPNCYAPYINPQPAPQWHTTTWTWPVDNTDRVEALEAKVTRLEKRVQRLRRAQYTRQKRGQ